MSQYQQTINSHIETYLDYYCGLSHAPGFAILLKGQWGCGKTWFINKYREKLKEGNHKCLYVSLYGMTSFSEIEDAFFQQLHPILSSKGMAITGKVIKGLLKGTLKIDLNDDGRDDGTLSIQIPEINLPEYLRNTDKSILVFDDLERCKIDIGNILGYINYFVEHQDLKVILIANEDELLKDLSYRTIKEKLIGKTFGLSLDFEGALENFINMAENSDVKTFLSDNTELIRDLYEKAEYENLRNLKQVILDFERIFDALSEELKSKPEILQDILKSLMAFSIEIKRGLMVPKDISRLQEEYTSRLTKQLRSHQSSSVSEKHSEELTPLQKMFDRYTFLSLHDLFPSTLWWQIFFDKGIVDKKELEQSILSSKYFQDESTPGWMKLWHFSELSDDDFDILLEDVETDFNNRKFNDLGVVKHIFGLFLMFSEAEIYSKTKPEILENSKRYIDDLKSSDQLESLTHSVPFGHTSGGYLSLSFQGKEFAEFKEFCNYINEARRLSKIEKMPEVAQVVLNVIQTDVWKFHQMVCLGNSYDNKASMPHYHETPILNYICPSDFIEKLLTLTHRDQ